MAVNYSKNNCPHSFQVTDLVTEEITCGDCGVVLSEKAIDFGPENLGQASGEYQDSARTGQKISLKMADMGLSTVIQAQNRDSSGRILSGKNKQSFHRLRMWDRNSKAALTKQSFIKAFTFLDGIRSKLGLPNHVVEKSAYLFRKAEQKKLLMGRSNQATICAVVYIACRITNTPRTLADIAEAAAIKKKILQRTYRLLYSNLEIHSVSYTPDEFIERVSSEIGVSEKIKRDARKILELSRKNGITSGKNPMSMAATAIYLSIKDNNTKKISQAQISEASGISAVTIRNRAKELKAILKI